ncbi:MAG: hypothetical protein ACKVHT_09435 [Flavobacteriales bacterium]
MKHFFTKGLFLLLGLSLTIACSSDDDPVVITPSVTISNLSFTAVASGDGNVITVTPSSTGGTSYSVDFGTDASDDVVVTAGPGVSYTYPELDASYTIIVTASAADAVNVTSEQTVAVDFDEPEPSLLEGTWVLSHRAGAIKVGPGIDNGEWYQNSLADVITRDCLFDDQYIFNADGSFSNVLGDATWLEPGLNGVDAEVCGTPQAPFDGTAVATWANDEEANTITINGVGAFLGLQKNNTGGITEVLADAPESITYQSVAFSDDNNTLKFAILFQDGGYFTFSMAKEGSAGAALPTTDTDGDGVLDYADACPTVAGTQEDGCPVSAIPEDAPAVPSVSADDVVSIYSDAYTGITVGEWNPNWGQGGSMEEEEIAGNNVRKYSNLTFSGIDLGADVTNRVNLSEVSTVTFDYWTSNATSVGIKLVNYGADGNYDAATNVEAVISREAVTGSWQTVTVGLSGLDNITADGKLGQLVLTMDGDGSQVVYIDNLFFY